MPDKTKTERPPIVVVLGHVDHGKSTLLDFIRKSNVTATEAGGITQHMGAYEIEAEGKRITFIDTPGHAAFQEMRRRGAAVADIAILVVAADDGVKPQTLEALKAIEESGISYIVAINKIDKPEANVDRTKQTLAEAGVYVEGYGGTIPVAEVSAKSGKGVPELLSLVLLAAELEELTADPSAPAEGVIVESHRDKNKGVTATLIIENGTLTQGEYLLAGTALAPVRSIVSFTGGSLDSASFSTPVSVSGWSDVPRVGDMWRAYGNKKEAEKVVGQNGERPTSLKLRGVNKEVMIPVAIKADTQGTLEAIRAELEKRENEKVGISFVVAGVGTMAESDVTMLIGATTPILISFGVDIDRHAVDVIEKNGMRLQRFDVIYKLTEWFEEYIKEVTPKETVETITGKAKILKTFSRSKDKQIIGGLVQEGEMHLGKKVRIVRRDVAVGEGKINNLQKQRVDADKVDTGEQFGAVIETKLGLAEGDVLEIVTSEIK